MSVGTAFGGTDCRQDHGPVRSAGQLPDALVYAGEVRS